MTQHAPDLDVTDARQGRRGRHAFVILVTSLALVLVALFGAWAYYSGGLHGQAGNREAPANVAQSVSQQPNTVRETAATAPAASAPGQAERQAGG